MLYSVNKPAMRQALDVAKKRLGHQDEQAQSFRLSELQPATRNGNGHGHGAAEVPPPLPALKMAATAGLPPAPVTR